MSKTLQPAKVNCAINSLMFERKVQLRVNAIVYNEELINYMKSTVESQKKIKDKLYILYLFKRVFATSVRNPDKKHYYFFENEYLLDRNTFDVDKWLKVEIEFYRNVQSLEKEVPHQVVPEIKTDFDIKWITGDEVKKRFNWSRNTLSKRIAEGMPCHAKGNTKLFDLEEIGEWFRKTAD
ncbi:hypothetical protein [Pedobacter nanyangensis]|uniref:hypothetical protein n=1 Tax=Pedobacter nanyangensis TaxID=1562389 RepID=UPI0013B406DD|nr:hypothetical protein [Pedobacter nanyangensis]